MEKFHRLSFRRSRSNTDVGKFHLNVEEISKLLDDLKIVVDAVRRKQNDILGIPPLLNDNRKQELHELHGKAKLLSIKVRSKLESISKKIKDFEKESSSSFPKETFVPISGGDDSGGQGQHVLSFSTWSADSSEQSKSKYVPAIQRVRKTQYSALLKRYVDLLAEYHEVQFDHRHRVKRRLIRQMEIMDLSYTEEELDTMINDGSMTAFTKSIVTDTEIARQNLEDITERQNDILKLEKSIRELNELFKELAFLVENQGGLIDNIANNIASTADYVDSGRKKTKQACKMKTWTTKKKAYLYTLGSSATVVTLVVVLVLTCL